jgi:hypothetical protein
VLRDRRVGRVHIGECDGVPIDPERADPDLLTLLAPTSRQQAVR